MLLVDQIKTFWAVDNWCEWIADLTACVKNADSYVAEVLDYDQEVRLERCMQIVLGWQIE